MSAHLCWAETSQECLEESAPLQCNTTLLNCRCEEGGGVQCWWVFVTELGGGGNVGGMRWGITGFSRSTSDLGFNPEFSFNFLNSCEKLSSSTAICCYCTVQCICTAPVLVLICSVMHCRGIGGFSGSTFITRSAFNLDPQPVSPLLQSMNYFLAHWISCHSIFCSISPPWHLYES